MSRVLVVLAVLLGCAFGGKSSPGYTNWDKIREEVVDPNPARPLPGLDWDNWELKKRWEPSGLSDSPIGSRRRPTRSIQVDSILAAARRFCPVPLCLVSKCRGQSGGWGYEDLPFDKWPRSSSPSVFYAGCKVWRPTWSSCSGPCKSSQNLTSSSLSTSPDTDCTCCQSTGTYRVRPYPRCWVIRINNGASGSAQFETVLQKVNFSYRTVAKCNCGGCMGSFPVIFSDRDQEEIYITGRPVPPTPSASEKSAFLATAARRIPGLRGMQVA